MRYDLIRAENGTWSVLDTITGWPAEVDGHVLSGMEFGEADDLVDLLNSLDREADVATEH
jgi:hypothetical protein